MFLLCHPWFTATNPCYTFPILETSATASCRTTGIYGITRSLPAVSTSFKYFEVQIWFSWFHRFWWSSSSNFHRNSRLTGALSPGATEGATGPGVVAVCTVGLATAPPALNKWARSKAPRGRAGGVVLVPCVLGAASWRGFRNCFLAGNIWNCSGMIFFDVMSTIKIMPCYAKQLHMLFWSRICNLSSSIKFLPTLQPSLMMLSSKPKGGGSLCTAWSRR